MSIITLMVIEHEVVEFELATVLPVDLPIEERSEWESSHQAVEESAYLLWTPDELTLNRGEYEATLVDLFEGLLNRVTSLVHGKMSGYLE